MFSTPGRSRCWPGHGLARVASTRPSRPQRVERSLRYEIRRLKRRLLAGEFAKERYLDFVIELRKQYWLLSVPVAQWVRTK
jgi:hypothetical protein